jgi:formylglycine-generating enzyme
VGRDDPDHPEEWPVREVELAAYRNARCAVTIADFAEFVG